MWGIKRHKVTALRDTGCSSVVVKEKFVKKEQYIGKHGYMIMADNTAKQVELLKINIDTPYYVGEVEAICLPAALYTIY